MTPECRKVSRWLDESPDLPLPAELKTHSSFCPVCHRRVAIDRDLRERLGAGAGLDPARRAALVDRIERAPATQIAMRRHVLLRWWWVPAAAAAIFLAIVFLHPTYIVTEESKVPNRVAQVNENQGGTVKLVTKHRAPISPTQLVGNLLGPAAEALQPSPASGGATAEASSPTADALLALLGDLDGPIEIARGALESPRPAAPLEPSVENKAAANPAPK
jgi:hypothetical protein